LEVTKDHNLYQKVLQKLIAQGLFQLLEKEVIIRCRQQDVRLVQGVLAGAAQEYKEATGKDVALKLDTDNHIASDSCGGVEMITNKGKIKITNTLESRLELISQQLLPAIRVALFGRNPNRKYND